MTDLLHTLPDFPTKLYTHLLPSLEKHLVTTTDLLTLDPLEIAKRAQLPLLDVRRLANHVVATLQAELGLPNNSATFTSAGEEQTPKQESLRKIGQDVIAQRPNFSTLSPALDNALDGGIPTGYITEITGERYFIHESSHTKPPPQLTLSAAALAKRNFSSPSSSPSNSPHPTAHPDPPATSLPNTRSLLPVLRNCCPRILFSALWTREKSQV